MAKRITVQAASVTNLLRAYELYPKFLVDALRGTMGQNLDQYKSTMNKRSSTGPLFKRSGRLKNSWLTDVSGSELRNTSGRIGSRASYSKIHEFGETVRPKNPQGWIYIPTIYNLRNNGRPKRTVRQVRDGGGKFMSLKVFRATQDNAELILHRMNFVSTSLLVDVEGFPAFTLVKSASYAAKLGFYDLGEKVDAKLSGELGQDVVDFWKTEI